MGQADAVAIVPDRVDAEPLVCHDLPFKVVADHPGLVRADSDFSDLSSAEEHKKSAAFEWLTIRDLSENLWEAVLLVPTASPLA